MKWKKKCLFNKNTATIFERSKIISPLASYIRKFLLLTPATMVCKWLNHATEETESPKAASIIGLVLSWPVLPTSHIIRPDSDRCLSKPPSSKWGFTTPQATTLHCLLCFEVYSWPLKGHDTSVPRIDVSKTLPFVWPMARNPSCSKSGSQAKHFASAISVNVPSW